MTFNALAPIFAAAGCEFIGPTVLQPAEPFLVAAGEAFRKSLLVTTSGAGETLCLRPEFTIPVCRQHAEGIKRYAYEGTVFRQRTDFDLGRPQEFRQAGVEAFGEEDVARADAEMVALSLEALGALSVTDPLIVMGDPAFFQSLVKPIGLPDIWASRLLRAFGDDDLVADVLTRMVRPPATVSDFENYDTKTALTDHVTKMMADHGMIGVGGRSAEDVAERFLKKRDETASASSDSAELCKLFLDLQCDGADVAKQMNAFGKQHQVDFAGALQGYSARFEGMRNLSAPITFSASFGRRLDYYTGFVFEIFDRNNMDAGPLAGGGRYDRLSEMLGGKPLPAVGFALWLDRIEGLGRIGEER